MKKSLFTVILATGCILASCTSDISNDIPDVSTEADTEISPTFDTSDNIAESDTAQTDPDEVDYSDLNNYYLSITGSYNTDDDVLSEVYAVFDFSTGTLDKMLCVPATSSYPCGVCDLKNNVVYYSAAEETVMNDRLVLLNNVYAYHSDDKTVERITEKGCFMNRMIPVGDRLYFAGGMLSSISVNFGWVDITNHEIVIPDNYEDIAGINVRDIEYSYADEAMYLGWYSLAEQNKLDKEFYERQANKTENNVRELTQCYLDKIDVKTLEKNTVECFEDFRLETFTVSQKGTKIFMYGLESEDYFLREDGVTSKFEYPGSALAVMSPDGESLYYINILSSETNGVPNTALLRYDFSTREITEITVFDFYTNNTVLLLKR